MAVQAAETEVPVDNDITANQTRGTMKGGGIRRGRDQGMRGIQQDVEERGAQAQEGCHERQRHDERQRMRHRQTT
jgi:hypothetical protein